MSGVTFRESVVVMIDTSRTLIRAGIGLHDLLRTPAVEVPACVGLRASTLNGDFSTQPQASSSKTFTLSPKVTDYLVGSQLDDAIASGQDVTVYWPFADGNISDWTQAEALWKYVLFDQLQLRRVQMESPVLLSIMPGLSRDAYERLTLTFFERFNVAGFAVLDRPMAQFYAAITGQDLSGVVVDIGQDFTDITPIHDGFPVHNARTTLKYGISDCERYLAFLLRSNNAVMAALSPPDNPPAPEELQKALVDLSRQVWKEGLVKVLAEGEAADIEEEGVTDIAAVLVAGKEKAVIESGMKKRANAKASAAEQARAREIEAMDLITVQFRGLSLTLGKERHRFCEPLFDPTLLFDLPGYEGRQLGEVDTRALPATVGHVVGQIEPDYRQYVWQGLFVTGELTNYIKGMGSALQARLAPFILSNPDGHNEIQPKSIKVLKIPDHFAEYREKGDGLASFLGSSIVAKISFTDSSGKNFVSKADYTNLGPAAVLEMSPMII
ncbi:actin-like ATPase domain-containing protein [Cristinia sonorae]|uniref:Actin-like ATPase domain-containing protein n=1 Tax=Cristinia sonorae TaxID=1940300 RepID=A0A8K0XMH3_9AGAR|nr:actin-like ATPase domain-containing protein [Cristinia sonorae]